MPLGPTQAYLARYNGYVLPGYVQNESFDSSMNVAGHNAPYADGSLSEYTGLENKMLSVILKVWEPTYLDCKTEVSKAATMVRSKKSGFAPLYVQYTDRYYEAMTKSIKEEKVAGTSVRTLEYIVDFECKPWVTSVSGHTITGTGTIDTDQVSRTIANGGWTPTTITVTGTNVTISGYTLTGDFAGFISISGAVTGMVIDTYAYTSVIGSANANDRMRWVDYQMYVGPGKTFFTSTGASSVSISYQDRWYL
jgi:hypothetical protein